MSTSTATKPKAKSKTDAKTSIRPSVQKVVNAYVITEKQSQSKLWPMVEEAMQMLETGFDRKEIIRQFRAAFAKANKIEEGELTDNADYVNYGMTAGRVTSIAAMGREWVDERKSRSVGFWRMYDESKEPPKAKATSNNGDADADDGDADDDTSVAGMRRQAKEGVANAAEYADNTTNSDDAKADKPWRRRCKLIVKNEPDAFIEMVEELIHDGLLPDSILTPLTSYLHGE